MEAIRRFVKVKNHQVNIILPDDFIADEVEVIILAKNEINYQLSEEQIQLWMIDLMNLNQNTSHQQNR